MFIRLQQKPLERLLVLYMAFGVVVVGSILRRVVSVGIMYIKILMQLYIP